MIYLDYPSISPIIFSIGPFEIRWYSMAYIIGFLFAWQYIKFLSNKKELYGFKTNLDDQSVDDLIFYSIIGLIVGARLAYVIFYNGTYYLNNPIHTLYVWEGGLSFHGGLAGIIIAIFYIKLKYKIKFYIISDLICSSAPVGIFFGRIANFIYSELYGLETSVPWAVKFIQIDNLYRHPSQLYEAFFEGIILFFILIYFWSKDYLKTPGKLSALFLIFYSFFRFIIEYFRLPDEQLGYLILNLTMGQLLSFLFFITGFSLYYLKNDTKKKS